MLSICCNTHIKSRRNKKKNSETITKVRPFINKYNWKEEGFQMKKDSIIL